MRVRSITMKLSDALREELARVGAEGGKTRAKNMTPKARSESARKAANVRWSEAKRKADMAAKKVAGSVVKPKGS
jgi:hypothetical protein